MIFRRFRWLKFGGLGLVAVLMGYGAYAGVLQITGNFHEVVAGELYRSAQPTTAQITRYKDRYGIKTIINLRGRNARREWYREEIAVSRKLGITHVDFRMSAHKILSRDRAVELISILKSAKKPILIHCKGGADRSGLVSALYLAATGRGEEEAEAQISLLYGHVGIPFLVRSYAMYDTFERLEPWFGFKGS